MSKVSLCDFRSSALSFPPLSSYKCSFRTSVHCPEWGRELCCSGPRKHYWNFETAWGWDHQEENFYCTQSWQLRKGALMRFLPEISKIDSFCGGGLVKIYILKTSSWIIVGIVSVWPWKTDVPLCMLLKILNEKKILNDYFPMTLMWFKIYWKLKSRCCLNI